MENDDDMVEDWDDSRRALGFIALLFLVLLGGAALIDSIQADPTTYTTGEGMDWDILFSEECNPRRFHDLFRMTRETFLALVEELRPWMAENGRDERYSTIEERIASVLFYFAHPNSQTGLQAVLARAGSTWSTCLHEVVSAIVNTLQLANPSSPDAVVGHYAFNYFSGVIGALDGTHIPICRPNGGEAGFRNRKGFLSQNVLVAVNFDLMATLVVTGAEGCANDQQVMETARLHGFSVPYGCFYLADAGYTLTSAILTPYRGTRYHLKEWLPGGSGRPRNARELFNLRHARLRACVERFFGMLKEKFPVLAIPLPYTDVRFQSDLILAVILVWNIIVAREKLPEEVRPNDFEDSDDDNEPPPPDDDERRATGDRDQRARHIISHFSEYQLTGFQRH